MLPHLFPTKKLSVRHLLVVNKVHTYRMNWIFNEQDSIPCLDNFFFLAAAGRD